ncbi:TIGR00304 family protein [Sulfolobus tengchongensis]|uniref:TIGR00304 family protein n=1 Tax=Sulfolobus tengchongensis TaxID=207809 RepID=A0AAX4L485_9CREN
MDLNVLFDVGFILIFIGIIVLFIGMIREASKSSNQQEDKQKTQVGGVIFIGPIPIVFGSSKNIAKWMLIVAIVLFVLLVIFYFII